MKRFLIIIVLASLIIGGDRGFSWERYYPLKEGYKWTYQNSRGSEEVIKVSKKEKLKGKECFVLECEGTNAIMNAPSYRIVSRDGVKIYKEEDFEYEKDSPRILLKFPLKKDMEWETNLRGRIYKLKVEGEEVIEVSAGKFRCIKILGIFDEGNQSKLWYTQGIGLVKYAHLGTWELKEFDMGNGIKIGGKK